MARMFGGPVNSVDAADDGKPRSLEELAKISHDLLIGDILPLWSIVGADHVNGGYAETLSIAGRGRPGPRRVRVSARQVYAFCEAAELGWNRRAAEACVRHGYRFLLSHSCAEGFIFHTMTEDDAVLDAGYDLYDQAFLLFAYAHAYRRLGDEDIAARARRLLDAVVLRFSHPEGGFSDRSDRPYPLRANPHMHLLEAALAWIPIDPDPAWRSLADDIVALFKSRLVGETGAPVLEQFDPNWRAIEESGLCRAEPGHNYEWAWLLMRWEELTGGDAGDHPAHLIEFAENFGYDASRGVAVNEVWSDGSWVDAKARLWPQTERLKAWLAMAKRSYGRAGWLAERHAAEAAETLLTYLDVQPGGGLWRDVMLEDGRFEAGEAPASSLYHIVCAISELVRYTRDAPVQNDKGMRTLAEATPRTVWFSENERSNGFDA